VYRKLFVWTFIVVALVAMSVSVLGAQDATLVPTQDPLMQPTTDPAMQPTTDPAAGIQPTTESNAVEQPTMGTSELAEPEFIGDQNQESVQTVLSYLQSRDPNLLAEDAEFFDLTTGQPTVGREPITQMQNDFFGQMFTGTLVQPSRVIAADNGWVVVEFNFSGMHTGTFHDTPATNLPVSAPMVGIFHVENGQIVNGRLYYDVATINQQLGMTTAGGMSTTDQSQATPLPSGETAAGETGDNAGLATGDTETSGQTDVQSDVAAGTNPQALDAVLDDPAQFYGQTVTVEGNVTELLNERMVRLTDDDLIAADSLLVLHSVDDSLGVGMDQNARVQVTGMVEPFVLADVESQFGIDLDDALFVGFENQPVLIADSITPMQ
jgi:ketosteroid isomerase-like protein